jgi:hypothetical protein
MPIILAPRRLRQEDHKFDVSLNYIERLVSKKKGWRSGLSGRVPS